MTARAADGRCRSARAGVVGDPHHDDQFPLWKDGTLLPVSLVALRPVDADRRRPDAARLVHPATCAASGGCPSGRWRRSPTIYGWIDEQDHLTADLVLLDGRARSGSLQTYDPFVDPIGEHYDRRPGDVGVHLFLADDAARAGTTPELMTHLVAHVFADPAVQRIVLEPDVDNEKSIALLLRLGAELGPVVEIPPPLPDLPVKTAQLAFLLPAGPDASGP